MEAVKHILAMILRLLERYFSLKYLEERFWVFEDESKLYLGNFIAVEYRNAGEVTAIINGVRTIPPGGSWLDSNFKDYRFKGDHLISFDTSNSFGLNTGTAVRLEAVTKKYDDPKTVNPR